MVAVAMLHGSRTLTLLGSWSGKLFGREGEFAGDDDEKKRDDAAVRPDLYRYKESSI